MIELPKIKIKTVEEVFPPANKPPHSKLSPEAWENYYGSEQEEYDLFLAGYPY